MRAELEMKPFTKRDLQAFKKNLSRLRMQANRRLAFIEQYAEVYKLNEKCVKRNTRLLKNTLKAIDCIQSIPPFFLWLNMS